MGFLPPSRGNNSVLRKQLCSNAPWCNLLGWDTSTSEMTVGLWAWASPRLSNPYSTVWWRIYLLYFPVYFVTIIHAFMHMNFIIYLFIFTSFLSTIKNIIKLWPEEATVLQRICYSHWSPPLVPVTWTQMRGISWLVFLIFLLFTLFLGEPEYIIQAYITDSKSWATNSLCKRAAGV